MKSQGEISRSCVWVLLVAVAGMTGCAPLTGNSAPGSGMCQNAQFSLTSDAFPNDQLALSASQGIAQSFVLQPKQAISSVSLRLEGISSTLPSSLAGTMSLYIVPDASDAGMPTSPNCTSTLGGSSCSGSAVAAASLSLSSLTIGQPRFYNFPLSTKVAPNGSAPVAYWIVATASYPSGSANYVSWDGTGYTDNQELKTATTPGSNFGNPGWIPQNLNMTFQTCK